MNDTMMLADGEEADTTCKMSKITLTAFDELTGGGGKKTKQFEREILSSLFFFSFLLRIVVLTRNK